MINELLLATCIVLATPDVAQGTSAPNDSTLDAVKADSIALTHAIQVAPNQPPIPIREQLFLMEDPEGVNRSFYEAELARLEKL